MKAGDIVLIDGESSFCTPTKSTVIGTEIRYDSKSGEKYFIIKCEGGWEFDSRTSQSVKVPFAYSVEPE